VHSPYDIKEVYRRLSVKGSGGVAATVVVKSIQGRVWVSITPPFTWEAIMEPGKVDELIHMLGLAREDAKKVVAPLSRRPHSGDDAVIREIASGTVAPGNKVVGKRKVQS
jgi:hypothetical protein